MNFFYPDDDGFFFFSKRQAPPVEDQPRMKAYSWRLIKTFSGALHLATLRHRVADRGVVRLSSAISAVDTETRTVTTTSGRSYVLIGPPEDRHLEYNALFAGAARLGITDGMDVSAALWRFMSDG
jgi:hypothetical protein